MLYFLSISLTEREGSEFGRVGFIGDPGGREDDWPATGEGSSPAVKTEGGRRSTRLVTVLMTWERRGAGKDKYRN
jgi:hypothetical protein